MSIIRELEESFTG